MFKYSMYRKKESQTTERNYLSTEDPLLHASSGSLIFMLYQCTQHEEQARGAKGLGLVPELQHQWHK